MSNVVISGNVTGTVINTGSGTQVKRNSSPLTDFEWTCLWGALRYFLGRMTIAAATFPESVIEEVYPRLTGEQRQKLAKEVYEYYKSTATTAIASASLDAGDRLAWMKFARALDATSHQEYLLVDGTSVVCFKVDKRIYPLHLYLREPRFEHYVPAEHIKGE